MGLAEIAPDVYVLRQPVLDVNATLVVGGEVAVVVDTLSTDAQAAELRDAVRAVTSLPLVLVNTHHHFDHCFGNGVLAADSPGLRHLGPRGGRGRAARARRRAGSGNGTTNGCPPIPTWPGTWPRSRCARPTGPCTPSP